MSEECGLDKVRLRLQRAAVVVSVHCGKTKCLLNVCSKCSLFPARWKKPRSWWERLRMRLEGVNPDSGIDVDGFFARSIDCSRWLSMMGYSISIVPGGLLVTSNFVR